jgi:hypothetical protein
VVSLNYSRLESTMTAMFATITCRGSLLELRRTADEMMIYFDYGRHLSNVINFEILGFKLQEGDFAYFVWPGNHLCPSFWNTHRTLSGCSRSIK